MEEYILGCLEDIGFNENNILNGSLFTCKESPDDHNPCQRCISCKLVILQNFSRSLLSHMTDNEVICFIKLCSKSDNQSELAESLKDILSPLKSKDRIYSLSRMIPSLDTDLIDYSIKNFSVDKDQLFTITNQIAQWISNQPNTFRLHFILSLLSNLKLSVLSELWRSISDNGHSSNSNCPNPTFPRDGTIENNYFLNDLSKNIMNINDEAEAAAVKQQAIIESNQRTNLEFQTDLISSLPIHISEKIINMLDEKSLKICSSLNENWKRIVNQVRKEYLVNEKIKEQAMLLQSQNDGLKSITTKPVDPTFARDTDVRVPQMYPGSLSIMYKYDVMSTNDQNKTEELMYMNIEPTEDILNSRKVFTMDKAYKDVVTRNVIIEERNVFCGSYSVMLIMERQKGNLRTISYNGGELVAIGGSSKIIQFLNKNGEKIDWIKNGIHGHTGSIRIMRIINEPGKLISHKKTFVKSFDPKDCQILSGSYDTTIRRWDNFTGKCLKIYIGHSSTITDLDYREDLFVSGSLDGTCRLWQYDGKHCLFTMRHKHPVTSVALSDKLCISGDASGLIKVWSIQDGKHIKDLAGHQKEISAIRTDKFHILSASHDCFAMLWSLVGRFNVCIGNFRHPKPVLSMEYLYLRAITGCEDGKIRIWNVLNGQCIRIIRGNSKYDPILKLIAHEDIIIINTVSNVLVLNFEPTQWIYATNKNPEKTISNSTFTKNTSSNKKPTSYRRLDQRFERSRFAGHIDPRIFLTPVTENMENISKKKDFNHSFNNLRSFDNGVPLNRSTSWIVSPTFNKSMNLTKGVLLVSEEENKKVLKEESKLPQETSLLPTGGTQSKLSRRISYGFESQEHLTEIVNLDQMKQTLRKHIRSSPHVSGEAMPDFIKTMVSQLKVTSTSGRPISVYDRSNRPSSGPGRVDSKSKVAIGDLKRVIVPMNQQILTISQDNINNQDVTDSQIIKSSCIEKHPRLSASNEVKIASDYSTNQGPAVSFFSPPDFRQKLQQRKLEFDQRHNIQNVTRNSLASTETLLSMKSKTFLNNLNLQTIESSQEYFNKIDKTNQEYETQQRKNIERDRYSKWLKNVTETPALKFEKDILMKRPRSAKI